MLEISPHFGSQQVVQVSVLFVNSQCSSIHHWVKLFGASLKKQIDLLLFETLYISSQFYLE